MMMMMMMIVITIIVIVINSLVTYYIYDSHLPVSPVIVIIVTMMDYADQGRRQT